MAWPISLWMITLVNWMPTCRSSEAVPRESYLRTWFEFTSVKILVIVLRTMPWIDVFRLIRRFPKCSSTQETRIWRSCGKVAGIYWHSCATDRWGDETSRPSRSLRVTRSSKIKEIARSHSTIRRFLNPTLRQVTTRSSRKSRKRLWNCSIWAGFISKKNLNSGLPRSQYSNLIRWLIKSFSNKPKMPLKNRIGLLNRQMSSSRTSSNLSKSN